jgi:hypothetical protein
VRASRRAGSRAEAFRAIRKGLRLKAQGLRAREQPWVHGHQNAFNPQRGLWPGAAHLVTGARFVMDGTPPLGIK